MKRTISSIFAVAALVCSTSLASCEFIKSKLNLNSETKQLADELMEVYEENVPEEFPAPAAEQPYAAQPLKGKFVKETDKYIIEANFNLYEKCFYGESGYYWDDTSMKMVEGNGKCYGTIEITNERGVTGYDIVSLDSFNSPEPNMWVVSWSMPEEDPIRVGIDYTDSTITISDWMGGTYFNNLVLTRK